MSVRVLLSVVFVVALLALVTPAIQDARHARQSVVTNRALDSIDAAATQLVERGAPVPDGLQGARRTVRLRLPDGVTVGFRNRSRVVRARADGHVVETRALPVPVHVSGETLRVVGRVVLSLSYERRNGRPVLVLTRGFIREAAAKEGYAQSPRSRSPGVRPNPR